MIGVPTTFVIGAGASKPYGLPLGWELHKNATDLKPDHPAYHLLASRISANKLNRFLADLRAHPATSIDAFLRTRQDRPDVMDIGKSMIASLMGLSIMEKEKTGRAKEDWLGYVIQRMLERASTWNDFCEGNHVKFVTFNFDSLIEQRLTRALTAVWSEATLDPVPVIHVHGQLPDVPDSFTRPSKGLPRRPTVDRMAQNRAGSHQCGS